MSQTKTNRIRAALLYGAALLLAPIPAGANAQNAADTVKETKAADITNAAPTSYVTDKKNTASVEDATSSRDKIDAKESGTKTKSQGKAWELEAEYLHGSSFENRHVNVYNLHYFQKGKDIGKRLSLSYGGTLQRTTGDNATEDHSDIYGSSSAVGLGPAVLLRYEYPISGRLTGAIDATGSLLFYNRAHPYDGRAYGFLWRIGPRFSYHYTKNDAITIGWSFHHSSNGMGSHNPGYNGNGIMLAYTHGF